MKTDERMGKEIGRENVRTREGKKGIEYRVRVKKKNRSRETRQTR